MQEFSAEKDVPNEKNYTILDKEYKALRTDPYGFWHLTTEKGNVPDILSGEYTSTIEIEKAIVNYISGEKNKEQAVTKD